MKTILHIESSSISEGSSTREIGKFLVDSIKTKNSSHKIIDRDLIKNPIPHLSADVIKAFKDPASSLLKLSNDLIDELSVSDIVIIESPMYNFSIPSVLKAWIDHIARSGKTFTYQSGAPEGLLKNKHAILILGRGGVYSSGPAKAMDFQEPYLRCLLDFIGIKNVSSIYIEGMGMGPEKAAEAIKLAKQKVQDILSNELKNIL